MTAEYPPAAVTTAFWLLVAGAVLLMAGGLMTATVGFETVAPGGAAVGDSDETLRNSLGFYRGAGVLFVLAGAASGLACARGPALRDSAIPPGRHGPGA